MYTLKCSVYPNDYSNGLATALATVLVLRGGNAPRKRKLSTKYKNIKMGWGCEVGRFRVQADATLTKVKISIFASEVLSVRFPLPASYSNKIPRGLPLSSSTISGCIKLLAPSSREPRFSQPPVSRETKSTILLVFYRHPSRSPN